jgi:formamidopyrimidine-DNA glycosylase
VALEQAVPGLDAVARGEHAVVAGQRWWSSVRSPPWSPTCRPRGGGDARLGLDARRDDDVVGAQDAVGGVHRRRAAVGVVLDRLERGGELHADALGLGAVLHVLGHVGVQRDRHDLVGAVDHRDLEAAADERLGHLQADVARADHDRALAAAQQVLVEALGGVDGPRRLDDLHARDLRADGDRARGDDELVERLGALGAGGVVVDGQRARVEVDRHDLLADAHVDAALAVLLRPAHDQPLAVGEVLGDEVRDPARRVGRVRAALEGDDLERRVAPQRLRRRAHPCRVATDDRESLSHGGERTLDTVPELPEVEITARRLDAALRGATIESTLAPGINALKTFDPPLHALDGRAIEAVRRIGKHLVVDVEGDLHVLVHLMSAGRLQLYDKRASLRDRTSRLLLRIAGEPERELRLASSAPSRQRGSRCCAAATSRPTTRSPRSAPRRGRRRPRICASCSAPAGRARCTPSCATQRVIAGIGRSWVDEILWTARLSPFARAKDLDDEQVAALRSAIVEVLGGALEHYEEVVHLPIADKLPLPLQVHRKAGEPCPRVARRSRRSTTRTTSCATARPSRPAARCSRTAGWPRLSGALVVGHDAVGGFFAWSGRGGVAYLAPDSLEWQDVAEGTRTVRPMLTGDLDAFAAACAGRWEHEVAR